MPDWLISTIVTLPALIWIIVGVGLPWTLVILPRKDWYDRMMVACLSLLFGPALLTAWMFILGTMGQNNDPNAGNSINPMQTIVANHVGGEKLLRADLILLGTVIMAITGILLAWKKSISTVAPQKVKRPPLAIDERLLIMLIIAATAGRWLLTSWLEFGAYDPLWVYGYQGKIYTLLGYIPKDIGYYPQFLSLQYAYAQIVGAGAEINDHAARAVLPFLQVGSILATYLLGSRLFSRRTGIMAAALWALYPHFGYWTRIGDLETPMTFTFTVSAAFFLMAWNTSGQKLRRRYALIAGLSFGVAMWTKPTAGAFVLGVVLVVAFDLLRTRNLRAWWPRFEVAAITGLACLPLGAVWYLRNVIIGHDAIVFPQSFWLDTAMRSGAEFGWPLLTLALLLTYVYLGPMKYHPQTLPVVIAVALVLVGVMPTILEAGRINIWQWAALTAGSIILTMTLLDYALLHLALDSEKKIFKISWAYLLSLPYFAVWFYSYSYHYRLGFAIVPLMILPAALILSEWLTVERIQNWKTTRKTIYVFLIIMVSLPGVFIAIYDERSGWDWLWAESDPDGKATPGLPSTIAFLQDYLDTHDEPPVIVAPGFKTLPFYFPAMAIHTMRAPRDLEELQGVTYYINNVAEAATLYETSGQTLPYHNRVHTGLMRENVATLVTGFHDLDTIISIYEMHIEDRFIEPQVDIAASGDVVFGDFVRFVGYGFNTDTFTPGGGVPVEIYMVWEVLEKPQEDYNVYLHLYQRDDPANILGNRDGPVNRPWNWTDNYYSTMFWEPGEYIIDRRGFYIGDVPQGDNYLVRLGFYPINGGERVPMTIDGEDGGDGYTMETVFKVGEPSQ
jgi:hypothetical protein